MEAAPASGHGHGLAAALAAGVLVLWLGLMGFTLAEAALEEEASGTVLAVFPPGTPDEEAVASVLLAGGQPVRRSWFAWVVHSEEAGFVGRLQARGAWAAYSELPIGPSLGGCAAVALDRGLPARIIRPGV